MYVSVYVISFLLLTFEPFSHRERITGHFAMFYTHFEKFVFHQQSYFCILYYVKTHMMDFLLNCTLFQHLQLFRHDTSFCAHNGHILYCPIMRKNAINSCVGGKSKSRETTAQTGSACFFLMTAGVRVCVAQYSACQPCSRWLTVMSSECSAR